MRFQGGVPFQVYDDPDEAREALKGAEELLKTVKSLMGP